MWRVRDEDQGMQMRFIGRVLVIDRGLLYGRHFPSLLAHELAHANSFDLFTRSMYASFPSYRWSVLTLVGLPCVCGPIVFHLAWMKYWRGRMFAADDYAALIGQCHALKRALDELRWALDGGRATRGGRWLRQTP
jgi:Zn-dependent protease with chaperone function